MSAIEVGQRYDEERARVPPPAHAVYILPKELRQLSFPKQKWTWIVNVELALTAVSNVQGTSSKATMVSRKFKRERSLPL
jgi:hypothetical protein